MAWLREWRSLVERPGFDEAWTSSCGWGPLPNGDFIRKEFRLLVRSDGALIHRPCPGFHPHRAIHGAFTRETAQCVPALCDALARMALDSVRSQQAEPVQHHPAPQGSERAALNELLLSSPWSLDASWS